jgi:hypothetical protein
MDRVITQHANNVKHYVGNVFDMPYKRISGTSVPFFYSAGLVFLRYIARIEGTPVHSCNFATDDMMQRTGSVYA